jgi:uncharacterized protein
MYVLSGNLSTMTVIMKTTLAHLPAIKQKELQTVMAAIRTYKEVEMVILFGSYARGDWIEEYENDGVHFRYQSDYDLLVIVKAQGIFKQRHLENDLMNAIHNTERILTPCSVIVHDIRYFNNQLEEGQYFFSDIKKEGVILYDSGKLNLQEAKPLNHEERYELAKEDFDHWFTDAMGFYRGFEFYMKEKSYNLAAFLLHQAAERYYNALLLVFTRYKSKTHDLDVLRRLTNTLDQRLIKVFPLNNVKEGHHFKLLRDAYIEARYKKKYTITEQELLWLADRVKMLQQLTEVLCKEKMQTFLTE